MSDVTSFTIPNRISLLLIASFFPAALALGRPLGEIGIDLAVGGAALVAAIGMFAAGWIGGGDAKLFAAVSLWWGWGAGAGVPGGHRPGRRGVGGGADESPIGLA